MSVPNALAHIWNWPFYQIVSTLAKPTFGVMFASTLGFRTARRAALRGGATATALRTGKQRQLELVRRIGVGRGLHPDAHLPLGHAGWEAEWMSHRGPKPATQLIRVTHEPALPQNWPDGHVGAVMTGLDQAECIEVTIHGVKHYLHSTTARELSNMLLTRIDEWNEVATDAGFLAV
jgi:hypothetical protein